MTNKKYTIKTIKEKVATLLVGGLNLCLFIVGLGFLLFVLLTLSLLALLAKPEARARWRQRWMGKWQSRQTSFYQSRKSAMARSSNARVIEGEYTVR